MSDKSDDKEKKSGARSAHYTQAAARLMSVLSCNYVNGIQAVVDIGEKLLGNPIVISDMGFKIIALSRALDPDSEDFSGRFEKSVVSTLKQSFGSDETISFLNHSGRLAAARKSVDPIIVPPELFRKLGKPMVGYGCIDFCIRIRTIPVAFMSVIGVNRPFTEEDRDSTRLIANAAAIALSQVIFFNDEEEEFSYNSLLFDILENHLTDRSVIQMRMRVLNKPIKSQYYIVTITENKSKSNGESDPLRGIHQSSVRLLFPGSLSTRYEGSIVLLAGFDKGESKLPRLDEFMRFLKSNNLCAGVSENFSAVEKTRVYYDQTIQSIRLGLQLNPNSLLYRYEDYVLFNVIQTSTDSIPPDTLVYPGMRALCTSRHESDHQLLETLYLYLYTVKDITLMTQLLHVHRSTLFYRINRIADILHADLNDGNTVLSLMFSFKVMQLASSMPGGPRMDWLNEATALLESSRDKDQ
ncbi:MAG: helix-turn-helix domain-containing protein [Lachnospiraceae bacterium]|jgi:sugar diacid utilization regulator